MSIESLEERYQKMKQAIEGIRPYLYGCALQASAIQQQMRSLLDGVAPHLCGSCEHKCCEGFPLEGWFSFEDYVLFRAKYKKPDIPRNRLRSATACSFLTPEGCSLPSDMRPFTCVKVNCDALNDVLRSSGKEGRFHLLRKALDAILFEVSRRINHNHRARVAPEVQHEVWQAPTINSCGV